MVTGPLSSPPDEDTATPVAHPIEVAGLPQLEPPTRTLRSGGATSTTLASLRGVDDPIAFARTLQEWKQAVTDRGHLPRYRVMGRLGQGSQGVIFGVADRDCRREVALKTLNPQSRAKDDISRFIHEAQITAQLEHPGIVPIHDLDVLPDGTVFYTMKKVEGHTLSDLIGDAHAPEATTEGAPVKPPIHDLLQTMLKICDTMAFAHSRNVIHRDLKPRNIMIGRYGEVLVMDWGLAKVLDGQPDPHELHRQVQSLRTTHGHDDDEEDSHDIHQTMIGASVGTPAYMSPEQAKGEPADRRSDLYSLGVMLYRCLVGESPYERGHLRYTLEQAVNGTWMRLDHRPAGRQLPKRLVAIVHTCMALDPAARYPSAEALAADLRSFLAGGAVSACHETLVDRVLRHTHAQRKAVFTGLGLLLLAGGGLLVLSWRQGITANEQRAALRRTAVQHELMGEYDEARHDLERLLDQLPDDRDAMGRLQRLRQTIARRTAETLAKGKRQEAAVLAQNEAVQQFQHDSATSEASVLLRQASDHQHEVLLLTGLLEEAAPSASAPLRARRALAIAAELDALLHACRLAPWLHEGRHQLTSFYLDRLDEAEVAGDLEASAQYLVQARASDDGT